MTGFKTKAELQRINAALKGKVDNLEALVARHDAKVDSWLARLAASRWSAFVVWPVIVLAAWGLWSIVR